MSKTRDTIVTGPFEVKLQQGNIQLTVFISLEVAGAIEGVVGREYEEMVRTAAQENFSALTIESSAIFVSLDPVLSSRGVRLLEVKIRSVQVEVELSGSKAMFR